MENRPLPDKPATPSGLSTEAAQQLKQDIGPNALPQGKGKSWLLRFAAQFRSPLIYVLLIALAIDLAMWVAEGSHGIPFEGLTILVILLLNALLGTWQEGKSEAALARLKAMAAPMSWVYRDAELQQIPSQDLVPGDVVRLQAGDRVSADGRVLQENSFSLDESVLSGESMPVEKTMDAAVFSGTLVLRGQALVEVTATGLSSNMGKLANMLNEVEYQVTPLQKQLDQFGRQVAVVVVVLAAGILMLGLGLLGLDSFSTLFLFAVALAVAAVPESLPAVLTLAMALGMERMVSRKAVVRRLTAVEALGSVTVIATDKTGTLTENRMRVASIDSPDEAEALMAMALVNDADPKAEAGDPLETGLYAYVREAGEDPVKWRDAYPRVSEKPFDSRWKYMRVSVDRQGQLRSYLKGAPDILLPRCQLSEADRAHWNRRLEEHAGQGFRALALASGEGDAESGLRFLGLVLLWDPPRPEVAPAIAAARSAGIRVLMMTGDHPLTAAHIAGQVGIEKAECLTGAELEAMSDSELEEALPRCSVLARVSPEHKLRVVKGLRARGEVVAVTGDGVNDAPALKAADVGVAMGTRGSDVSREVSDLILLDDNFATIVAAVEEGRSIYENIQKFIRTLFSTNLAEVLLIVVGAVWAFSQGLIDGALLLPLTAVQILWVNLLTDSLPALALTTDLNPGVMKRPPRAPGQSLLGGATLPFIFLGGLVGGTVALGLLAVLPMLGWPTATTQTVVFCYLVLVQLSFVLPARRVNAPSPVNYWVWGALILVACLQLSLFVIPSLGEGLGVVPLTVPESLVLGASLIFSVGAVSAFIGPMRRRAALSQA